MNKKNFKRNKKFCKFKLIRDMTMFSLSENSSLFCVSYNCGHFVLAIHFYKLTWTLLSCPLTQFSMYEILKQILASLTTDSNLVDILLPLNFILMQEWSDDVNIYSSLFSVWTSLYWKRNFVLINCYDMPCGCAKMLKFNCRLK